MSAGRHSRALLISVAAAAALGSAAPIPGHAAELGRIFMTPEQRRVLDQQRRDQSLPGGSGSDADLLPARTGARQRVVLNGVMRREGKPPLVWINGVAASEAAAGEDLHIRRGPDAGNRVTLESGSAPGSARLKPGQTWDRVTGRIIDCAGCGSSAPATPGTPASGPAPESTSAIPPAGAVVAGTLGRAGDLANNEEQP